MPNIDVLTNVFSVQWNLPKNDSLSVPHYHLTIPYQCHVWVTYGPKVAISSHSFALVRDSAFSRLSSSPELPSVPSYLGNNSFNCSAFLPFKDVPGISHSALLYLSLNYKLACLKGSRTECKNVVVMC